jgi:hypothetical protein
MRQEDPEAVGRELAVGMLTFVDSASTARLIYSTSEAAYPTCCWQLVDGHDAGLAFGVRPSRDC